MSFIAKKMNVRNGILIFHVSGDIVHIIGWILKPTLIIARSTSTTKLLSDTNTIYHVHFDEKIPEEITGISATKVVLRVIKTYLLFSRITEVERQKKQKQNDINICLQKHH